MISTSLVSRPQPPTHPRRTWWEDTIDKKLSRVDVDYLNNRGWSMYDADGTVHPITAFQSIAHLL